MKRGQSPDYAEYARRAWDEKIVPLRLAEERLRGEQRENNRLIAGLRSAAGGGWNPVRGVREAYRRATQLPPLIDKNLELERKRAAATEEILNAARGIAAHVCEQEAKRNPPLKKRMAEIRGACEAAEREVRFLAPLIARTNHMIDRMEDTHAECRHAKTMCEYGIVGSGVAVSMMADSRQKSTERALNLFAHEMKNYAASLAYDYPRALKAGAWSAEDAEALGRRLYFSPDCFGEKPDFSAYLKNHKLIEQAMGEIERVHGAAAAIRTELGGRFAEENRNFAEADLRLRILQAEALDKALPDPAYAELRDLVRNPSLLPVSPVIFAGNRAGARL